MPTFKRRSHTVEAVRVDATDFNMALLPDWKRAFDGWPFSASPEWLLTALEDGKITPHNRGSTDYAGWDIVTNQGTASAAPGDWIIFAHGEVYPCNDKVMQANYAEQLDVGSAKSSFAEMWPALRRRRADAMVAHVMEKIGPLLCSHSPFDNRKRAVERLLDLFHDSGIDVVTDEMRRMAGLPERNDYGLTPHELHVLEVQRIQSLMNPPPIIVKKDTLDAG